MAAIQEATSLAVSVNPREFTAELALLQGAIERKTTIPILGNILLEAGEDALTVSATNLDVSMRSTFPAAVGAPGACTIPARKLYDYVRLLPSDKTLSLELMENQWVSVKAGRSKTKMIGMARSSYPALPEMPSAGVVKIPAETLRGLIKRTLFAVPDEEGRYTLRGALLVLDADKQAMISTDGHRMALAERMLPLLDLPAGKVSAIIPAACLGELAKLLQGAPADADVDFAEDHSSLFFRVGARLLTSRKLTGQFPKYESVIPNYDGAGVVLDSATVAESLHRALLFTDPKKAHAVKLGISETTLDISAAAADLGETQEQLDIVCGPADPVEIGFNGTYIRELLELVDGAVTFKFHGANSAGLFTQATEDGFLFRYIVMPIRLDGGK